MTTPAQPTTDEDVESLQEIIRSGWLHKMVFTTQYVAALEALARLVARLRELDHALDHIELCSYCGSWKPPSGICLECKNVALEAENERLKAAGSRLMFVLQHVDNEDRDELAAMDSGADEFRAVFWPKTTPTEEPTE